MSDSVHGHDVMALMVAQGDVILKSELISLMAQKFGESARYHTCSVEALTAQELIDFLVSKGKCQETAHGITLVAGRQCNH
ncbi:YecH family protein [Shewanella profunda]|uniref:YecH family metal-binding protein n=1 Tax=Shewanella profunda TaxID=254793 RepID=UPI00200CF745|nr:YecH family metal-binding protein [Shewanella profunda]MCL1089499.1 YecH family protein [Shewanella profunda]